ncbi:MAG: (Fe-S)-binding protein [Candidatus Delongbacteria bacterium]|nr:(Fe-S)-binding protein [Candidatus Delongbacteria bacterium]
MLKLLLALLALGIGAGLFLVELLRRLNAVSQVSPGWPEPSLARLKRFVGEVLFQRKIIRHRPLAGWAHALVFWAFLAFALETLNHLSQALPFLPYGFLPRHGWFHTIFQGIVGAFAWAALGGILYLFVRRFILRPAPLGKKLSWESGVVAFFIATLMVTYLLKYHDPGLYGVGTQAGPTVWWIHTLTLCAFMALIPRSKHLHLVLGPLGVYMRNETMGHMQPLDFENEETGAHLLSDLARKDALAAFACVECGRCMEHCPATQTGKALDPKQLVLRVRGGLLDEATQAAVSDTVIPQDWLWQCTTCGSCALQCPTGNDQPLLIQELRRGLVSEGEFPATFRTFFDNLERSGNPWRYQSAEAVKFIRELDLPMADGSQKVLYWMGCMARYDESYRKVALDFVRILRAAGVDFGVLVNEKCTGDAARRAGNEMAFQELAMENAALINEIGPSTIVSTCPHCIKTLEEYKDLAPELRLGAVPIVHHSAFIKDLVQHGHIELKPDAQFDGAAVTYHDACYLSRYIGQEVIDAPRDLLRFSGAAVVEPERHGDRSFCCGAGGAMLFAEETEGTRINHARTDELLATGAKTVCTACPFCRTMISDGVKDKGRQEEIEVLDLAQLVARSMVQPGSH